MTQTSSRPTALLGLLLMGLLFALTAPAAHAEVKFVNKLVDSTNYGYAYGYAPSIVYDGGKFSMFYCSDPSGAEGYDSVRLVTSGDGRTWDAPRQVLTGRSLSIEGGTCDPSVVRYQAPTDSQPYYYMFYAGFKTGVNTLMFVARSTSLEGPFEKWTTSGTWEKNPTNPQPIILPTVPGQLCPVPGNPTNPCYGAGQPTVVVDPSGKLRMWWGDDSCGCETLLTATTEYPTNWPTGTPIKDEGSKPVPAASVDIKYDASTGKYRMFAIDENHASTSHLVERTSSNGTTWSAATMICGSGCLPAYSHNVGISGGPSGNLIEGRGLIVYGAPYDLRSDYTNERCGGPNCWGHWDLYGAALNPAGKVWNQIPWGWPFPKMTASSKLAVGDYDGDGEADPAFVNSGSPNSTWYTALSSNPSTIETFVWAGMGPNARLALGDYDGDGKTDKAIVEDGYPTGSHWFVIASSGESPIPWGWEWYGMRSWEPLALGDYDGDGKTDRTIIEPNAGNKTTWYTLPSTFPSITSFVWAGMGENARLALGDYDGDGKTDKAIIEDGGSEGSRWFIIPSAPFVIY